jgi:hypothetical protein
MLPSLPLTPPASTPAKPRPSTHRPVVEESHDAQEQLSGPHRGSGGRSAIKSRLTAAQSASASAKGDDTSDADSSGGDRGGS